MRFYNSTVYLCVPLLFERVQSSCGEPFNPLIRVLKAEHLIAAHLEVENVEGEAPVDPVIIASQVHVDVPIV